MSWKARIRCIGNDDVLLETHCAKLRRSGYDARYALYEEAHDVLQHDDPDLMILSASLTSQEHSEIISAIDGKAPIITFGRLTLASELFAEIEAHFAHRTGKGHSE